jgi:hypothetical protein
MGALRGRLAALFLSMSFLGLLLVLPGAGCGPAGSATSCSPGPIYDGHGNPTGQSSRCPSSEPGNGDPCDDGCLFCEYGEAPSCRSLFVCAGGAWERLVEKQACPAMEPCPEDADPNTSDPNQTCATKGALCVYPAGHVLRCEQTCSGLRYFDKDPPFHPSCPLDPPGGASACGTDGITCTYRDCVNQHDTIIEATCEKGAWIVEVTVCCSE